MSQCWRLDDPRQTLVLGSHNENLAEIIYWGAKLPCNENLDSLLEAHPIDVTGGMLDSNPALSLCPEASQTFSGQPGLIIRNQHGATILPQFRFHKAHAETHALTLTYLDQTNGLTYTAHVNLDQLTGIIEAKASLKSDKPIILHWLAAPVFPAPQQSDEMIDFTGRWCSEFQTNITPWSAGIRYRENLTGRTGHEHFPGLLIPCRGATHTQGLSYAFHYGWSGGHRMVAEELPDGRRQIQFGHTMGSELEARNKFETATLYASFSDNGMNGCSRAFQRHVRERVIQFPEPKRPPLVHYNCWEAVYFNHNVSELKTLATHAADLGAERFVLDDGWFKKRDDDKRALSDWTVDPHKYPEGLQPLIDHIHGLGMTFGLWFEPEMINKDSDTYRTHPEWVLGDQNQTLGRGQNVLNMALSEVRDNIFAKMASILTEYPIDYIKWDHNRVLPTSDAAQTQGTYALIDRLREAFPKVDIETCASGGGRIDFGILKRTQRVWLSDSNDALERLRIQHHASTFLPLHITGSHVGPRTCHTSGRTIDIRFRAWVAAMRCFGFEMDPRELTEEETSVLKNVTAWWKHNREWMTKADILKLDTIDPAVIAEQQLANDASRFVVFAGKAATSNQIAPRPLCLTQLVSDAYYTLNLLNKDDASHLSRGSQTIKQKSITLSGRYLMNQGLTLPWSFPETMWVIEGTRL